MPDLPPSSALPAQPKIVAIGGIKSKPTDGFFSLVNSVAPSNTVNVPLGNTGHGIGGVGIDKAYRNVRDAINANSNAPTLVAGHSLGGVLGFNLKKDYADNPNINFMQIDPPHDAPWGKLPGVNMFSPTTRAINQATKNNIAGDTNTIDWTHGKAVTGGGPAHTPWDYPDYPGNKESVSNLVNTIKARYEGLVPKL